ncbi:iron-containing alcohol dehydrogenase [Runella aurantiaca]|uniref:Iron-containing alcohol dehydrogenase n=1 Tax=Runella aurantiaca TaxID=2282308 RepID=A0A369I7J8_9BACT|nr:iron-containing alcohol dehydrogenase [Runella aurantiaca]RDB03124.1 iron-containing alcohol dehydrogenase [Runella aurantiaca]
MINFQYHNPVRIIFGKGQIAQLSKQIPTDATIMITYGGGSIFKNGVYEQVKSALAGHKTVEFGGIEANPTYETLMKAVELGRAEKIDFLLAVGGGSVLDGTKFIAAAIPFTGNDPWQIVGNRVKITTALPLGAVLTLPATGSEMNYYAVISRKETHEKKGLGNPLVYPKFSILDPETTFSLPPRQIANGIADAFTHVMEQYMTYSVRAEMQDRMAEAVLLTLIDEGPKMMLNPTDYDAAANVMWAATMALNGLLAAGVPTDWATHQIGHELTALHGIDHARTLAVVLPHLLEIKKDTKRDKLVQYGKRVWQLTGTDDEVVAGAIQKTAEFYESLGIPTKASAYPITEETVQEIVKRFVERGMNFGERADITPEVVGEILELSLN